jgi:hypothetical protein
MGHLRAAIAAASAAFVLAIVTAAGVSATPPPTAATAAKTIDTVTGECTKDPSGNAVLVGGGQCGAAVYGDLGFSGHIYGSRSGPIVDYVCVHVPSASSFASYGGTYTFTVYDAGGNVLGSTSESVTDGQDCNQDGNAVTSGSIDVDFAANGGVVSYTVSIEGMTSSNVVATFAGDNSLLNRVVALGSSKVNSPSVAPPAPVAEVPEAPLPSLLVVTAGLTGLVYVTRRRPRSR